MAGQELDEFFMAGCKTNSRSTPQSVDLASVNAVACYSIQESYSINEKQEPLRGRRFRLETFTDGAERTGHFDFIF